MISLIRAAWQEELRVPMFVGLSTDGYPASDNPAVKNGARIYHMDTGKEYEYSQDDDDWYEVPSGGGSGDMTKAVYDPDNAVADAGGISQYVEVHGLPDASELEDGTAMVAVNGEWKMQEGYGYNEEDVTVFDEFEGEVGTETDFGEYFIQSNNYVTSVTLKEGNAYFIKLNGVEYAFEFGSYDPSRRRGYIISEEFGENYKAEFRSRQDGTVNWTIVIIIGSEAESLLNLSGNNTVEIYEKTEVAHQFNPALIPSSTGEIIDVGSNQYVYESYSLPAIPADKLRTIYANHKDNKAQVIKWTLLGSETYLTVLSADYIVGTYSIDVLVHNKYHCQYNFTDSTAGNVNPEVLTSHELPVVTIDDDGKFLRVVDGVWAASTVPNAGGNDF